MLPIISGIVNGAYFGSWSLDRIDQFTNAYILDMKKAANDWAVPGAKSFRQFQDTHNDFHLLRLNTNDWNSKLGFILPREFGDRKYNGKTPINFYADLRTLMLDTSALVDTPPKEHWVYISNMAMPSWNTWDSAFNAAVQEAYVPSALNKSRIFFATCFNTASFLCSIWGVRSPTLLHFFVEDSPPKPEDIDPGLTYSTDLRNLRPVTVRVIELPLQGVYTGLTSDVFPGEREQMRAIMRGDRLFEQFEPWHELGQWLRRFQEHNDDLYKLKGTSLYYLGKADDWASYHLAKPLGVEIMMESVSAISFFVSSIITRYLVLSPWNWAKKAVQTYLGYPKRQDWIYLKSWEQWNPLNDLFGDGMMGAFWESVLKRREEAQFEKNWPGGKITTLSPPGTTPSAEFSTRTGF